MAANYRVGPLRDAINSADYEDLVALSTFNEVGALRKFGSNPNVGTSYVPVTFSGTLTFPTAATTASFVSASANDTAAGSGLRSIAIVGLDANFEEQTAVYSMNGTTPVVTTETWTRIFRAFGVASGQYATTATGVGSNAGAITVSYTSGGTAVTIPADFSGTLHGAYTVPAGKKLIIKRLLTTVEATKSASLLVYIRPNADNTSTPSAKRILTFQSGLEGSTPTYPKAPAFIPSKTDIWAMVKLSAGTGVISVVVDFRLYDE